MNKHTISKLDAGGLFYIEFWNTVAGEDKKYIASFIYDPGGYPQYQSTFEEWSKRCIRHWETNGAKFVRFATAEEWLAQK